MSESVKLELSKEEAIVLFEYLTRNNDAKEFEKFFEDQSEQRVLWDIESMLESILVEPSQSDYLDKLKRAREAVRDE